MEFRTLRTFVEVVRQGGFSKAAKVVFATQSTVSKAVKQLEDEVGTPLLDRVGHNTTLTAVGEVVYRRALAMLAERHDLDAELDELRGLKRGALRLGLPPVGSSVLYAPIFAQYRARYPAIDIRLTERGSDRLKEALLEGAIDIAGVLLPVAEDFEWQSICLEPLVVLLPAEHPLARYKSLDLPRVKDIPFVLFETGFAQNRLILNACSQRGFEPVIAARTGQIDFMLELVAMGVGIAFLPRMIAELRSRPDISLARLSEPNTEWHMALIWRRGAYLSHAAKAWLELAREIHDRKYAGR